VQNYITQLLNSELPFEPGVAVLVWAALFLSNHWIAGSTRAANKAQHFFAVEDWSAVHRGLEPKYVLVQVLYAGLVFLLAQLLGGSGFVFLAGGLIVAIAYLAALNVQGLWSGRALSRSDAATGALTFSTAYAFRHMAYRLGAAGLACALIGLATAHLALLGGAFFLGATAGGYLRRAKRAGAQP